MPWDNVLTLLMLVFLQAVLGFDNLLYISIESKRAPAASRKWVRRMGIGLAIGLRLFLLVALVGALQTFQVPLLAIRWTGWIEGTLNLHSLVVLLGGVFILFTSVKEISHLLSTPDLAGGEGPDQSTQLWRVVAWIVAMNAVFSFDSILSAIALTDVFWVMAVSIVFSGILMMALADRVADFLEKNRMVEVLGLFILFLVGVMLLSEGGHLAHLTLAGYVVEPMAKSTFYFTITVLVVVDVIQDAYAKRLRASTS